MTKFITNFHYPSYVRSACSSRTDGMLIRNEQSLRLKQAIAPSATSVSKSTYLSFILTLAALSMI